MFFSRLRALAGIAALLLTAGFLHYSLPSRDVVRIVGTDVVRQDVERRDAEGNRVTVTRDVRFIYAKSPGGGDRVYRNEDTGWGWPPYFKFDTADLAAQATDRVSTAGAPDWVVMRHYGWRIPVLSMFPNALSIRSASGPDDNPWPWFNIIFVTLLVLSVLIVRRVLILLFRRHVDPVIEEIDREFDQRAGAVAGRYRQARRWVRQRFGV
ncbi:MAG: DUF1523 family protein [Proteobacteria bacterium]|nr:DUF1523 family protein [Pseudomonadota bacterium]